MQTARFITRDHMVALGKNRLVSGITLRVMLELDAMADENGVAEYTYREMCVRLGIQLQSMSLAIKKLARSGIIIKQHAGCERSRVQFSGAVK